MSGCVRVETRGALVVETPVELTLVYTAGEPGFRPGGNLWVFYDIRQFGPAPWGTQDYDRLDGIVVRGPAGSRWSARALNQGGVVRTLDLFPVVTEFLHALHVRCDAGALPTGAEARIELKTHADGFLLPRHAIDDFSFGLVEDPVGALAFQPVGDGKYWHFRPREAALPVLRSNGIAVECGPPAAVRAVCPSLAVRNGDAARTTVYVNLEDAYGNPAPAPHWRLSAASAHGAAVLEDVSGSRAHVEAPVAGPHDAVDVRAEVGAEGGETGTAGAGHPADGLPRATSAGRPRSVLKAHSNPVRVVAPEQTGPFGLFWGDLHGMLFNQRPFEDYFRWARDVARLDFAGGQLFSYLACVREAWERLVEVWHDFDQPGRFVALPSVECGTPPDGSHRHYFLPEVAGAAPIFCEDRPVARDPMLLARFHPETVFCADYRALYREAHARGGFVHGHFHTRFYEGETLAEIYQKQVVRPEPEEGRINAALRAGARLGIVGGSDTHDSRPANPHPERGTPKLPAGLTAIWAERLDRASLFDALRRRRCYATTGQRLLLDFRVNGAWMGAEAPAAAGGGYEFQAEILGPANVQRVELVVNGEVVQAFSPDRPHAVLSGMVRAPGGAPANAGEGAAAASAYCYLRVLQADGNRAWSSPVWLR
ncbi:MAG: DUF3604 domain-containing protein [Chloroflexota bacterium]